MKRHHKIYTMFITLSGVVLGACASSTEVSLMELAYNSEDNLTADRIEITYENRTKVDICLPYASFPLDGQIINFEPGKIYLTVNSVKYPLADLNAGYCASNCETKVPAGTKVFGFLPYSDFNLPKTEYLQTKKFRYEMYGFECRR